MRSGLTTNTYGAPAWSWLFQIFHHLWTPEQPCKINLISPLCKGETLRLGEVKKMPKFSELSVKTQNLKPRLADSRRLVYKYCSVSDRAGIRCQMETFAQGRHRVGVTSC